MSKNAIETWAHRTSIALVVALLASLPPQDIIDSNSPFDFYNDPDLVRLLSWHDFAASRRSGETWGTQELLASVAVPPFPFARTPKDAEDPALIEPHQTVDVIASPDEQSNEKSLPRLDAEPGIDDDSPAPPSVIRVD